MAELASGAGPLFTDPDPEAARRVFRKKRAAFEDKVTSVRDAVRRFVRKRSKKTKNEK
jgi:hypothetical protein